jgi:chromosome segregation ATPase
MTPERIEEIKHVAKLYPRTPSSYVNELLAALEEAQHRIGDLETGLRVSERTGMKWYDELAEAQKNYKYAAEASEMVNTSLSHVAEERNTLRQEMAEAQQTIARQREALEKIDKACRKRSFNDCGDLRAVVYDIAYAALGGETQP